VRTTLEELWITATGARAPRAHRPLLPEGL